MKLETVPAFTVVTERSSYLGRVPTMFDQRIFTFSPLSSHFWSVFAFLWCVSSFVVFLDQSSSDDGG